MSPKISNSLAKSIHDANTKRLPSLIDPGGPPKPKVEKGPMFGEVIAGPPKRDSAAPANTATGEFAVELDPSKRPDLASFDRGGFSAMIDLLHPGTQGRAQSTAELRDAANSLDVFAADRGSRAAIDVTAGQDLAAAAGRTTPTDDGKIKTSPRTNQQMDGAGSADAGSADGSTEGETKTEEKGIGETIVDGAKAVGTFIRDWAVEVVTTKFGPPGPWTTPLTGPAALDSAGGDVGAIVDGAKTIGEMQDGDYFGKRLRENGVYTPAPDSTDAPVNAGEAASRSRIGQIIAAMVGPVVEHLRRTDKSNITLPSEDGVTRPRPTKDDIGFRPDPKSSPRTGNQVNPGTGDADIVFGGLDKSGPLPKRDPGFVDPPEMIGGTSPSMPDHGPSGPSDPDSPNQDD